MKMSTHGGGEREVAAGGLTLQDHIGQAFLPELRAYRSGFMVDASQEAREIVQPFRSEVVELGRVHCLVPLVSLALLADVLRRAFRGLTCPRQPTEGVEEARACMVR